MNKVFDDKKPIFLQMKEMIEDQIVNGQIKSDEQIPSTTQMVNFYKVNHITILKGINLLVDEGILYKKRGIGLFVSIDAKSKLLDRRKRAFGQDYLEPMLKEAKKLGLSKEQIITLIYEVKERDVR